MKKKYVHISSGAHELVKELAADEGMHLKYYMSNLIVNEALREVSGITDTKKFEHRYSLIKKVRKEVEKEEISSLTSRHKNAERATIARIERREEEKRQRRKRAGRKKKIHVQTETVPEGGERPGN